MSASSGMPPRNIHITVNGRRVQARSGASLIEVTRRMGLSIPTLCHVDGLEPSGACRICIVEEIRDGTSRFVTACNYPVRDGMVFDTRSESVVRFRRLTVESLLARCPEATAVRQLADELGVQRSRFPEAPNPDDKCILCGCCTRVCEAHATAAISMQGRGMQRVVAAPGGDTATDCVGCGACERLCPTGHIRSEKGPGAYSVFGQTTRFAVAQVTPAACRGCGICEEVCPFRIPRVILKRNQPALAVIDPAVCRGCGVCTAACPTQAIVQPRVPVTTLSNYPGLVVFACTRSGLTLPSSQSLPPDVAVIEMPCVGALSLSTVFAALLAGASSVLIMGRAESTCRLNGSEDSARDVVRRAAHLAALVGLGEHRVDFVDAACGVTGPHDTIRARRETMSAKQNEHVFAGNNPSIDSTEALIRVAATLRDTCGETSAFGAWLAENGLPPAIPGQPTLIAGDIPILDVAMGHRLAPSSLIDVLRASLVQLKARGCNAGVAFSARHISAETPAGMIHSVESVAAMDRGDADMPDTVRPGHPVIASFVTLSGAQREDMIRTAASASLAGASHIAVRSLSEFVQYSLLLRQGAWRNTHARPALILPSVHRTQRKAGS